MRSLRPRPRPAPPSPLATAVAAWGLPGAPPIPDTPLSAIEFGEFAAECDAHRIVGLAALAADAGDLPLSPEQIRQFAERVRGWFASELRHEELAVRAVTLLDAAGIQSRVLKGVANAHLCYPQPEMRTFGDIDLLVQPGHFHRAAVLLAELLPAVRIAAEPHEGFDDEFGREILLRRGGEELDLHRTFVDGYYGLCVPVGELFDGGNGFVLGDREVTALPASARLVHACLSAAVADAQPRLAACRDIVQLMTMTDADEAVAVAERWKCTGPLAAGVLAATQLLPAPDLPLVRWAHQHPPRITTRTLIAIYRSGWRGPLGLASGLLAPLGVRGRVRYLRGIVRQSWVSWRSRPG
ncbi:MAG TPA: nucleotidyltransferase family protein [Ilumatobacteraceae bacterium]|nr:nucleotidyltransferase family protein [Ilumatobacteraceae bacterium]